MQRRSKSAIRWLVIFGIVLLLSILLGEGKTTFRVSSRLESNATSGETGAPEKQVSYECEWQLPAAISRVVFAILVTLSIWLCSVIYRNSKNAKELRRSCDNLRDSLMRHEREVRKEIGELKASVANLTFESLKRDGKFRFTKDMPLTEALAVHPDVAKVLFKLGMACISCPSAAVETIEQAAQVHGMDAQPILDDLNKLLEK